MKKWYKTFFFFRSRGREEKRLGIIEKGRAPACDWTN